MDSFWVGLFSALWLGIITSISPCPLASNIAAVSFLSKKIQQPTVVFISGLAYSLGRMVAYGGLGWIIIHSLVSVPQVALFLQKFMGKALGPVLIMTGLVLFEILRVSVPDFSFFHRHHSKLADAGAPGAFLLGFILALAFCPISAALFFGSLLSLALNRQAGVLLPLIYGIGTALPVLAFSMGITLGVTSLAHWFHKMTKMELYMRKITGVIFMGAGIYYVWAYWLQGGGS